MKNWWHIIQNILNLLGKKKKKKRLFDQVDFEEETVGDHTESSNSVKDIGTIGCCSKRRLSAVKFRATWGWGSSWIMNLLGLSSNCFWQNFYVGHLVSFSQQSEQMSSEWEKYMKSLFYSEIFAQRHDKSWGFIPCSNSWQNSRREMTLPLSGSAKHPKVTTCLSANHYLNIHPLNYPVCNRDRHTVPFLQRMMVPVFRSASLPFSYALVFS